MSNFKKYLPFILLAIVLAAAILIVINSGGSSGKPRDRKDAKLNEYLSYYRTDKIPYGQFVAYNELGNMFPGASVSINRKKPGDWDSLSSYSENQALIIITPQFNADLMEMRSIINFAENGNDVFISCADIPYQITKDLLDITVNSTMRYMHLFGETMHSDTLTVSMATPPFTKSQLYTYPGKQYDAYFTNIDSTVATVLGYHQSGLANFVHYKAGKGNVYIHLAPLAFSNYFLMHKDNLDYYEKAMSLISPNTTRVVWDEYYRFKKDDEPERDKGWLSVLLNLEVKTEDGDTHKPFKIAFWLLLLLLVIYVLNEMRRKQRIIPDYKKPRNDSLDFVKTIGRLYHDRGDHRNLCMKMAAYFLEHVRSRYKIPTNNLNEEFILTLHNKSGIPQEDISHIVSFIRDLGGTYVISARSLVSFHSRLESFYNKE